MIDNGIKPVYVFDGKAPEMKSGELAKRSERRAEAEKQLNEANEVGDVVSIEKFERRLVKVSIFIRQRLALFFLLSSFALMVGSCTVTAFFCNIMTNMY